MEWNKTKTVACKIENELLLALKKVSMIVIYFVRKERQSDEQLSEKTKHFHIVVPGRTGIQMVFLHYLC